MDKQEHDKLRKLIEKGMQGGTLVDRPGDWYVFTMAYDVDDMLEFLEFLKVMEVEK